MNATDDRNRWQWRQPVGGRRSTVGGRRLDDRDREIRRLPLERTAPNFDRQLADRSSNESLPVFSRERCRGDLPSRARTASGARLHGDSGPIPGLRERPVPLPGGAFASGDLLRKVTGHQMYPHARENGVNARCERGETNDSCVAPFET